MSATDIEFNGLLAVHVLAALTWLGATVVLTLAAVRAAKSGSTAWILGSAGRRLSVLVAAAAGIGIVAGFSLYAFEVAMPSYAPSANGWMFIRLGVALAIAAFAVSIVALRPLRAAQRAADALADHGLAVLRRAARWEAVATILLFAALGAMVVGGTI